MRAHIAALVLAVVTAGGAAQPVDRQKLRQIARLPPVPLEVRFGLGFSPAGDFQCLWETTTRFGRSA